MTLSNIFCRVCGGNGDFMKLSTRILAAFLALLFSLTVLIGCDMGNNAGNEGTAPSESSSDTGAVTDSGSADSPDAP